MEQQSSGVRGFVILGVCIVLAATVFGIFFYASRATDSTVRVVGAATKRVDSDVAKLRLFLSRSVGRDEVRRGYQEVGRDLRRLEEQLLKAGFTESEININPASANQNYDQQGYITGYNVQQSLVVISKNVDALEGLALSPDRMMEGGTGLQSMYLEYYSSRLADLKKELLAEATTDARKRAEEIVRGTGLAIVGIESARAGVFQITEPYSTEVTDYGVYSTSTREKDITVTVAGTFLVK